MCHQRKMCPHSFVGITGFIKSDLRRQKANLQTAEQSVSVSISLTASHVLASDAARCILCCKKALLVDLGCGPDTTLHCCKHEGMELSCNFLSALSDHSATFCSKLATMSFLCLQVGANVRSQHCHVPMTSAWEVIRPGMKPAPLLHVASFFVCVSL